MRQTRTSGSVGAPSRQRLGATRPASLVAPRGLCIFHPIPADSSPALVARPAALLLLASAAIWGWL